jgi:membrane-bound metal-dependent hydrolase YbcI (DUF457 family)
MFIGHVATAFAAKKLDAPPSLGTYVLAATLPDVIFSALLLAGKEKVEIVPGHTAMMPMAFPHYPYSHSLVAALVAGLLMAAIYWARRRRASAAAIILALVVGHWVLDVISHVPDMPVGLSGPVLGLGLWRSVVATFAVEGTLFVAGLVLYLSVTRSRDRVGRWSLVAFVVFLALSYVSGPFSPPPPSVSAIAIVNNVACWLMVFWAAWLDRHRERRT